MARSLLSIVSASAAIPQVQTPDSLKSLRVLWDRTSLVQGVALQRFCAALKRFLASDAAAGIKLQDVAAALDVRPETVSRAKAVANKYPDEPKTDADAKDIVRLFNGNAGKAAKKGKGMTVKDALSMIKAGSKAAARLGASLDQILAAAQAGIDAAGETETDGDDTDAADTDADAGDDTDAAAQAATAIAQDAAKAAARARAVAKAAKAAGLAKAAA